MEPTLPKKCPTHSEVLTVITIRATGWPTQRYARCSKCGYRTPTTVVTS